jgi:sugar phosphate isomerase/epimerase
MEEYRVQKYMDDLGMKIISSHCDILKDFERKAAEAAEIGMNYLICPWKGPQKSINDFKKFADEFNKAVRSVKRTGSVSLIITTTIHSKQLMAEVPQTVMMNNTDKNLVDFEMDIYWVVAAGEDPKAWFENIPDV